MKRGLKKTLFMIKGTKKRPAKKRAMKQQVIFHKLLCKWVVQVQTTKKKMNRKNKNTKKL